MGSKNRATGSPWNWADVVTPALGIDFTGMSYDGILHLVTWQQT